MKNKLRRLEKLYAELAHGRPPFDDPDDMKTRDSIWRHGNQVGYYDARQDIASVIRSIFKFKRASEW